MEQTKRAEISGNIIVITKDFRLLYQAWIEIAFDPKEPDRFYLIH